MSTRDKRQSSGLEIREVEHGSGLGAFLVGKASHISEFRIQREASGGPCGELSFQEGDELMRNAKTRVISHLSCQARYAQRPSSSQLAGHLADDLVNMFSTL